MSYNLNINIAIVGCISSGKSTLLNSIFIEHYSNMRIKRDTMVPQVYKETNDQTLYKNVDDILKENSLVNKKYQVESDDEFKKEDCKEVIHYISKNKNFINMPENINIHYYDIPGLNDCSTKDIYYEWFDENFYIFDIIIFIVDINSAMNTSDEKDILNKVKANILDIKEKQNRDVKLVVLVNKCDDLSFSNRQKKKFTNFKCNGGYFALSDDELDEMYKQILTVFDTSLKDTGIDYHIMPISAIDIFVYRHLQTKPDKELDEKLLNKFGENEFGKRKWKKMDLKEKKKMIYDHFKDEDNYIDVLKNTGFNNMINTIENILNSDNQYDIFRKKIQNRLSKLVIPLPIPLPKDDDNDDYIIIDINSLIEKYNKLHLEITEINYIYKKESYTSSSSSSSPSNKKESNLYELFIISIVENITKFINNYIKLENNTPEDIKHLEYYKNILKKFYINDTIVNYKISINDSYLQAFRGKTETVHASPMFECGGCGATTTNREVDGEMLVVHILVNHTCPDCADGIELCSDCSVCAKCNPSIPTKVAFGKTTKNIKYVVDIALEHLTNLQNEYYISKMDCYEEAYTDFPNNLTDNYLEKLNENGYDEFDELIDNVFKLCLGQKDYNCDFNKIYFEYAEENRFIKFCEYVVDKHKYPLVKLLKHLEYWLLNRYIINRQVGHNHTDNKYNTMYPYLLNYKLNIGECKYSDIFYKKLFIMNTNAMYLDIEIADLDLIENEDMILQVFNYYRKQNMLLKYVVTEEEEAVAVAVVKEEDVVLVKKEEAVAVVVVKEEDMMLVKEEVPCRAADQANFWDTAKGVWDEKSIREELAHYARVDAVVVAAAREMDAVVAAVAVVEEDFGDDY